MLRTMFLGSQTLSRLRQLTPKQFAQVVAILLNHWGVSDVKILDQPGDSGIDGEGEIPCLNAEVAFQAKKWRTKNVVAPVVREFIGAVTVNKYDCGILATASSFTYPAEGEAWFPGSNIILLNGLQLSHLMLAKELGATVPRGSFGQHDMITEELDEAVFRDLET